MQEKLTLSQYLSYGSLGFSIAFVGLPLYLYIPKYYSEQFGLSLQLIGFLIIFSRLIDTFQDPLIGYFCDTLRNKKVSRLKIMMFSTGCLIPFFYLLLNPISSDYIGLWFFISLSLCYTAYSFLSINFFTLAAELTADYIYQSKLTSAREGFTLIGVAVASALPSFLEINFEPKITYLIWFFVFIFASICGLTLIWKSFSFEKFKTEF